VTLPSDDADGLHAPGLRFGDRRVIGLLAAIVGFTHRAAGFDNRRLTRLVARLLDWPYSSRQATYDLRRLRRKGPLTSLGQASTGHEQSPVCRPSRCGRYSA
jgi:hypothetical protein